MYSMFDRGGGNDEGWGQGGLACRNSNVSEKTACCCCAKNFFACFVVATAVGPLF